MGRVISVANQKGGVGKTTTAVNLAASLSLLGRRTLLIDMDPQASATSGLRAKPEPGQPTIYEVLTGAEAAEDAARPAGMERLFIIPATRELIGAEVELVSVLAREHRLREALYEIRNKYDYILIDCPPSLGLLAINGLTASDSVLVPVQCEYYALEGLSALMKTVDVIRKRLNGQLEIEGLLPTMFDTRNSLDHQVIGEMHRHFPGRVFSTVIPRNVRLSEAPSHGVPAVIYDANSRGAMAYQALAAEMTGVQAKEETPSETSTGPADATGSHSIAPANPCPAEDLDTVASERTASDAKDPAPQSESLSESTSETAAEEGPAVNDDTQQPAVDAAEGPTSRLEAAAEGQGDQHGSDADGEGEEWK